MSEKTNENAVIELPEKQKFLIWVTGSKGGTGKSTFARGLLDILTEADIQVAAFDGDPDNSQLYRFYNEVGNGVTRVKVTERTGGDDLILAMEDGEASVILVDTPAGAREVLPLLEDELGLLSAVPELGYRMTMVTVLSRVKDSVNQLKYALDSMADYDVAHVAVKNGFYGEASKFRFLDRSKTKQRLLDNGGAVLEMRDLYEDTYELLDDYDLSFLQAIAPESEVPKPDIRRIRQWRKHLDKQVRSANGLLGL